jgi:hypothetical protein
MRNKAGLLNKKNLELVSVIFLGIIKIGVL